MTTRNEYVEQLKKNLDKWNADISNWEAKARAAKTDLRIDYEMKLEDLRKRREEATAKLKELQATSGDAWKELKAGTDAAWAAMREAFDKAASHFQK
jgi:chromosome segregation ATPase